MDSLRTTAVSVLTLASCALLSQPLASQATALLREGDVPAGAAAGQVVTALNNTAVNQVGGYAVSLSTSDGISTLSHVWGEAANAGSPTILRTEGVIGTLTQNSFESFYGIDDAGQVAYSASCDDSATGGTGLDSVWVDGSVFALEETPIPTLPGKEWRFASRPGITGDGQPYWVGGIDDTATGNNEGNGLFLGVGATVLLKTGDVIPPLSDALDANAADFDSRVSAAGSHWISKVTTVATSTNDEFLVVDGAVYQLGSDLVGEGELIPAASGGNGVDAWDNFDFLGITEGGTVLFTGDTDGDTSSDEFIARDGVIVYREGDVLDGRTLTGSIEGAFLNESGGIGYVWDVDDGFGGSLEALGFEDKILLVEGGEVDWDGDGFVDAGHVVDNFTGLSSVTVGPDASIYFTADVDVPGVGILEGFFCIAYDCLKADVWSVSAGAGGTQTLDFDAGAGNAGSLYGLVGSMSGTSPGFTLAGVNVPLNPDAYFIGTVQQANTPTYVNTFGFLDTAGRATSQIVVPADASLAGLTAHHAAIAFGIGPLGVGKASGAVSIVLVPGAPRRGGLAPALPAGSASPGDEHARTRPVPRVDRRPGVPRSRTRDHRLGRG